MSKRDVPLDFLSWHTYSNKVSDFVGRTNKVRETLDRFGYTEAESILDEWNYLTTWENTTEGNTISRSQEGAAFVGAVMSEMQNQPLDMLMYYYVQPGKWDGVFDFYTCKRLKTFYTLLMFSKLYGLGTQVFAESDDEDIYVTAAKNGEISAVMLTYYSNAENPCEKDIELEINCENQVLDVFLLDDNNDMKRVFEVSGNTKFAIKPNDVLYITKLR